MARTKEIIVTPGSGQLRFSGFSGPVDYELLGDPSILKRGTTTIRGSIITEPEVAQEAFRKGEGVLTLDGGAEYRLIMLAHSKGAGTTYFEMRL